LSEEEIADIIAKEFNFSFDMDLTIEACMWPAEEIHYYLTD